MNECIVAQFLLRHGVVVFLHMCSENTAKNTGTCPAISKISVSDRKSSLLNCVAEVLNL